MPERTGDLVSIERLIENEDLRIEVLHPGGLALSTEFARQCHIRNGTQVLEVASGTGETACLLAADLGARVTCGVLASERIFSSPQLGYAVIIGRKLPTG
ncbi:MAG TPA: hypothetical protein VGG15_02635 [Terriglobales bacterium]|jgi:hypothetical protein